MSQSNSRGTWLGSAFGTLGRAWRKYRDGWIEHGRLPGSTRVFRRDIPEWTRAHETARGYVLYARYSSPASIELTGGLTIVAILAFLFWCWAKINLVTNFGVGVIIAGLGCIAIATVGERILSKVLRHTLQMHFKDDRVSWRKGWHSYKVPINDFDIRRIEHKKHSWKRRTGKTNNQQEAYEVIINSGRSRAIAMRVAEISSIDADEAAIQLVDVISFLKDRAIERTSARRGRT